MLNINNMVPIILFQFARTVAVEHKALKRKESKTRTFSVGSDEESDNESSSTVATTPDLSSSSPEHKVGIHSRMLSLTARGSGTSRKAGGPTRV